MVELTAISLLTGIYLYSLMFFLISSLLSLQWGLLNMAGPAGFEPAHARIKTWCLTAWRRPNFESIKRHFKRYTLSLNLRYTVRQDYSGLPALRPLGHQQKPLMFKIAPGNFVEPAHARIKTWCLTAWRRPNI